MTHEHHRWMAGSVPPFIRAHSLAKHRVLRAYLERYVAVLTADPRREQLRLTLVDGFAGGGRYLDAQSKEERPGSPMIMLQAMRDAAEIAQQSRSKAFNLDVQYIFIEEDPEAISYLREVIAQSEYGKLLDDRIRLIRGKFEQNVQEVVKFIENRGGAGRAIFFLDQFGYSDVPLPVIRTMLATLDNAEVILTFATDWLIDYLSDNEQTQQILDNIGISLPSKDIATAKEQRSWRRTIQFVLHGEIPEKTGAKFYTPFFIRSIDSHRDFWLIHLSGHFRARDVMVGLHWKESTSFAHYGRSGLRMLGYDQTQDADWASQKMLPGFYFDETALASSQEELLPQLPERLSDFQDGIEFNKFFSLLTNDSPVTADIMRGVLNDIAMDGDISIRDKTGTTTRRAGIKHGSDIIIPNRQKRLFLPLRGPNPPA